MQFMVYDPNFKPEEATPPTPEMMAEMGKFIRRGDAGRRAGRDRCAPAQGHAPASLRWEIHRDRWAIHRIERTVGRLGRDSGEVVG